MHFILKMLIAKYGKDIAVKLYNEYKANKAGKPDGGSRGAQTRRDGFRID